MMQTRNRTHLSALGDDIHILIFHFTSLHSTPPFPSTSSKRGAIVHLSDLLLMQPPVCVWCDFCAT